MGQNTPTQAFPFKTDPLLFNSYLLNMLKFFKLIIKKPALS